MPKICYLHAGFPKTASSSFQATCRINKDLLQDTGITYPYFTCSANKQRKYNHSYPIISLFTEEPEKKPFNKRLGIVNNIKEVNSAYESQLEGFLSTSADILISGEGIPDLSAQSLSALVDKISSYGYQIKATALIRSPYFALCSTIQQRIKGGVYVDLISFNNSVPNP